MTTMSEAAPPKAPELVAQVTAASDGDGADWVLTLHKRYHGKTIGEGPHVTQPSTAFKPDFDRGAGDVLWLTGYRLHTLNQSGDVRVTANLLVTMPTSGAGPVKAVWHEDHQTVPTELYVGGGTVTVGDDGGADRLNLTLTEAEFGSALTVTGLLGH